MDNQVKTANLRKTEFLFGNTSLVDLLPYFCAIGFAGALNSILVLFQKYESSLRWINKGIHEFRGIYGLTANLAQLEMLEKKTLAAW